MATGQHSTLRRRSSIPTECRISAMPIGDGDGCDRALRAPRRQRRFPFDRHRRTRPQDEADGRQRGRPRSGPSGPQRRVFRQMATSRLCLRRFHPHHRAAPSRACKALWQRMAAAGDIYLSKYAGWYSVRQEAYFDEKETTVGDDGVRREPLARRSSGPRRRPTSSASRSTRTSCSRTILRIPTHPAAGAAQ